MGSFCSKMSLKKLFCAVLVGLVIVSLQGPLLVSASSIQTKTVKIGYYENDLFMEGASEDAVKTGYAYEYFMKLAEYTGWRYEYAYGSFNDLYQDLVDGKIDMLAGLAYRDERVDLIGYPEIAMGSETYNLIKKEDNVDVTTDPVSLRGHTIGVLQSAVSNALEGYLVSHNVKATIKYYTDNDKLFEAFDRGDIDLLASEGAGTKFQRDYNVVLTFGLSDYYICVNKQKPELLRQLNEAQTNLLNDEPYFRSSLSSKYFASSVSMQAFSPLERTWLKEHDTLTVGYLNNYLPYSDTDSSGEPTGVITDVFSGILGSLNIKDLAVEYVGFDRYDDMISAINDDEIDAAFPVGGGLYYSEINGIYQTHPLVSVSTELIYDNVVINPNAATFAVNECNKMQQYYIKTNYPDAELVTFESTKECLRAVQKHKVDCTTLNGLRANEILKNQEYSDLSIRQLPFKDDRGIGVKIGNEGLLRLLNRGIHILGEDYTSNISYKYVEDLYDYGLSNWLDEHFLFVINSFFIIVAALLIIHIIHASKLQREIKALKNASLNQRMLMETSSERLRKPVSEIHELAKMAATSRDDDKLVEFSTNKIVEASGTILSNIDELVDLSLLGKHQLVLKQDKTNILELIKNFESYMMSKAEAKHITLTSSYESIISRDVLVDNERLTQILQNIFMNAITFTPHNGSVDFKVTEQRCNNPMITEFIFVIKDDGIGISEDFKDIVFDPFTREDTSFEDDTTGPGLGLTISKELARLMDGDVTLISEKDKGTEVTVRIKCKITY